MKTLDGPCTAPCSRALSRRQAFALLAALGVNTETLAQVASKANPRSYRVVLENQSVRVLEYKSRPGLGVCGEGMHSHPAHLAIALTGAKVKVTQDGKTSYGEIPAGEVMFFDAEVHMAENVGGAGARFYLVELKGRDWKPSTG
jgi:beta-alanine degradation protein BauB